MGTSLDIDGTGEANTLVSIPSNASNQTLSFKMDKCIDAKNMIVTIKIDDQNTPRSVTASATKMSITCNGNDATAKLDESNSYIDFEGTDSNGDDVTGSLKAVDNEATNLITSSGLTITWDFSSLLERLQDSSDKFADELNVFTKEGSYNYSVLLTHETCPKDDTVYADFDITNFPNSRKIEGKNKYINQEGEGFSGKMEVTAP
jgi:hypothetical protein